jgi:Predicted nucleic acid-binding protein, contains PIN domain
MNISIIVTGASQLITFAISDSLNNLFIPEAKVFIPDIVKHEVEQFRDRPGAQSALDWINEHQSDNVIVYSTEVFEEYTFLCTKKSSIKIKHRGEQAAVEIFQKENRRGVDIFILLLDDADDHANFLTQPPENVLLLTTPRFLSWIPPLNGEK